jgi:hypothetical protein
VICSAFGSSNDAWEYFVKHSTFQTVLDFESFKSGAIDLVSNRLTEPELERIWDRMLPGENKKMSKIKFLKLFLSHDFTGTLRLANP